MRGVSFCAWGIVRSAMDKPADLYRDDLLGLDVDETRDFDGGTLTGNPAFKEFDLLFEDSAAGNSHDGTKDTMLPLYRSSLDIRNSAVVPYLTTGSSRGPVDMMAAATASSSQFSGGEDERQRPTRRLAMLHASDEGRYLGGYSSGMDTIDSLPGRTLDERRSCIQTFWDQFSNDLSKIFPEAAAGSIEPEYLEEALRGFTARLRAESSHPFQSEAAVTLHEARQ